MVVARLKGRHRSADADLYEYFTEKHLRQHNKRHALNGMEFPAG